MDDAQRLQQIEELLEQIDQAGSLDELHGEPEMVSQVRLIARSLKATPDDGQGHLPLDQLRELARQRKSLGSTWEMPAHLQTCRLCLELFELVLAGVGEPQQEVVDRYVQLRAQQLRQGRQVVGVLRWVRYAAAAVILLALLAALWVSSASTSATLREGVLALAEGGQLGAGDALPQGALLVANQNARAEFEDGSELGIDQATQLELRESLRGKTIVTLKRGRVVAQVTPRDKAKPFLVSTQLGEVEVVGTRFSVSCRPELGISDAAAADGHAEAVVVMVLDGVVLVRNQHEMLRLSAGQSALLRADQAAIDVWNSQGP